jgi:hypothetical protein
MPGRERPALAGGTRARPLRILSFAGNIRSGSNVPMMCVITMAEDLTTLDAREIEERVAELRRQMQPLERQLGELRAARDVLLTELRRRERLAQREARAGVKEAMKAGQFPTIAELVAGGGEGDLDGFRYHLKTGGEVRLGFPGARHASLTFTDGRQVAQARDLGRASELYNAGWELGSPGRPGVRVHFPGTRQERLADPDELYARPLE